MDDYYKQDEIRKWEFEELNHGFSMNAKHLLPAGSMISLSSDCEPETYYIPSYFYREERK